MLRLSVLLSQGFSTFSSANWMCISNSRTLFKHAKQFVQQHEWLGDIIPLSPVTTQLWETSAKGTSQQLCLWRMFCGGTLCGDIKWRAAIASQLVTREDQSTVSVQYKWSRGQGSHASVAECTLARCLSVVLLVPLIERV